MLIIMKLKNAAKQNVEIIILCSRSPCKIPKIVREICVTIRDFFSSDFGENPD